MKIKTTYTPFWRTALCGLLLAATLASGCASTGPRENLEYGRTLMASGRLREAVVVFKKLHEANPEDAATKDAYNRARAQLAELNGDVVKRVEMPEPEVAALASASSSTASSVAWATAPTTMGGATNVTKIIRAAPTASSQASVAPRAASGPRSVTSSQASSLQPLAAQGPAVQVAAPPTATGDSSQALRPLVTPFEEAMNKKVTLQFRDAPVRSLFDAIGKISGLNIVIDKDVQQDLQTTVYLRDTTVRAALEKIVLTTRLGWRSMDENTLLIYPDEPAKQADYQSLVVRGFHLANADAKMVATSMKTILKFSNVMVDEKLNMIVVRDTPQAIALAEQLIALHDVAEPEVMLEVAILEVSKGKLQNLGVAWPTSATLTPLARTFSSGSSTTTTTTSTVVSDGQASLTVRDLFNLTPGTTLLSIGGLTLNAGASDSEVNILASPRIRAKNREKAKILIGERVPNISATATSNGVVSQNITYVDVGLKLEVEPQIFPGNEIGLKISLEVSSINEKLENKANGNVAYRIGTRNTSTVLRLKDGENQVLAGLIQDSDRKTVSKVPLLGDIPILGYLFRSDSTDKGKTEVVLSITPRLIRGIVKPSANNETFDAGTVTGVRGRRNEVESSGGVVEQVQPQPQPQPASSERRNRDEN